MIRTIFQTGFLSLLTGFYIQAAHGEIIGTPSNKGAGINLDIFDYYAPNISIIDQFKRAGGWYTQCSYPQDAGCTGFTGGQSAWDTLEQAKLDLDENGWPKSLPGANDTGVKYRKVSALMFQSDGRVHKSGKYVVVYEGSGTIEYSLAGQKVAAESVPGRDVVNVTNNTDSGLLLTIKTTDPANHIRNIRVYPPGGVCTLNRSFFALTQQNCTDQNLGEFIPFEKLTGRTWHPSFVADLKGFRSLRFLDWNRANSSEIVNWADRPMATDAMWTGPNGVPYGAMISLANEVGADPWINIPMKASNDFVIRFARFAKANLAAKLNLIVEYSNEPWNYAFPASLYIRDRAAEQWPEQIAKGVSVYELQPSWYGMHSAQLCQLIKNEFGADAARVKCVLNGQAANSWVSDQEVKCPYAVGNLGKPCSQVVDALAIAPYFGSYIGDPKVRSTVKLWYSDSDGGLGKLFEELLAVDVNGNKVTPPLYGKSSESDINGAVAQAKGWMQANFNVAKNSGLPLMSYEGGQHLIVYPGDTDQQWLNLLIKANRDPRMGKAYTQTLQDWRAAGGQTYTYFNYVALPSKYGAWGLKETQLDVGAPKWKAALPYRDTIACWWNGCTR